MTVREELDDLLHRAQRAFSAARKTGDEALIREAADVWAEVCRTRIELLVPLQRRGD